MSADDVYLPEVLFEFVTQGRFVKVMAVDPRTGTEVAIVGDVRSPKSTLENIATQKLRMMISKAQKKNQWQSREDNLY